VAFADLGVALEWLETHVDYERVAPTRRSAPTLEPIRDTLHALGDPQLDFESIHVTGTNGKGTTTTLTGSLLAECGLRVGTFTSPDLHAVNERIAVAGIPIDDESFSVLLSRLADVEQISRIVLTRFELLTVGALLHFSDEGVDVAVVEVGLGGTWDSTNVIDGSVAILTNVDLDHMAVLGNSIAEIARDKSGIFRPGRPAVIGTSSAEVVAVAAERAAEIGAQIVVAGREFAVERNDVAVGGRILTFTTPFERYEDVHLSLHGAHQGDNAATAATAAELFLGRALGDDVVRRALGAVTMPGRLELLAHRPTIVVDGAHNPAGVRSLAKALDGAFHVDGVRRCVIGMLAGRDEDDMVAPLVAAGVSEFFCCSPASPRAMDARLVADAASRAGAAASVHPSVPSALAHARERSSEDDLIVVAGSLYLVAEVRAIVLGVEHRHR
jgi:dihydrofolate synthase/folylpolyglutamate synthase